MRVVVKPSSVRGVITAPASKSAMQRACAAALISKGETILHNPGISADDKAALDIIQQLGAEVEIYEDHVRIVSNGINPVSTELNCGESGLSIRMFTAIAALSEMQINITGGGSLQKRPMNFFNEVLPQLGVHCETKDGYLPITVQGPLQPKNITVDGSLSSQYLTGLLFAYSAANATDVTITVSNLASKPYIDLTLEVLKAFHLKVPANNNYQSFYFDSSTINRSTNQPINYTIEGDWSGAAFILVAGAITGSVVVKGLDVFSQQADKAILRALMQSEAVMSIESEQISVRGGKLKAFHFNATDCPDLFPPLVALGTYCDGTSVIEGVHRLTHKESNRALTLQEEFAKMGVEIQLQDDLMIVKGGAEVKAATVHSHHDHRIAMACAITALKANGEVVIEEAEAVNKSYPQFWKHLEQLQS